MTAKELPKKELTAEELDALAAKICVENGITEKGWPSKEVIDLCLKSWNDKFSAKMNRQELALAFEMNVNGDLEEKVQHFQCFSRDFFCEVCNKYLNKKYEVIKANPVYEKNETPLPEGYLNNLMQCLITDRENVSLGQEITSANTVSERINILSELFEVSVTETQIEGFRINAIESVLREVIKRRNEARSLKKFGREIELTNQIVRIKKQQHITDADESLIQAEVLKLIYCNTLLKWNENEFVEHIKSQME